ncbi:MAG: DUF2262 domain-containing protein [Myxococcota bacterium]
MKLEGLVSSSPGGAMNADGSWTLVVHLRPWRGEQLVEGADLRVEHRVGSSSALSRWMGRLRSGDAMVVEASRVSSPKKGLKWFVAEQVTSLRKTRRELKLAEARARIDAPIRLRDEKLGHFTYDRGLDAFVTTRKVGGRRYELTIDHVSSRAPEEAGAKELAAAREPVLDLERRLSALVTAVTKEKLPLYNESWRGRRPVLDAKRFAARLRLSSVNVGARRITVFFADGGLFLDHVIEVRLDARTRAIREICLAG